MNYQRKLTPHEVALLGVDPQGALDAIVHKSLAHLQQQHQSMSIEARLLSVIPTAAPVDVNTITRAHNVMYVNNKVAPSYVRVVVSGMYRSGLVNRVGRGRYTNDNGNRKGC